MSAINKHKSRDLIDKDFVHSEGETAEERELDEFVAGLRRSPRLAAKKEKEFRELLAEYRKCTKE